MRPAVLPRGSRAGALAPSGVDFAPGAGVLKLSAAGLAGDGLLPGRVPGFQLCESPMKPRPPLETEVEGVSHLIPSPVEWQWSVLRIVGTFTGPRATCPQEVSR